LLLLNSHVLTKLGAKPTDHVHCIIELPLVGLQMSQPQISGLGQLKTTTTSGGGLQLGQNPSLLLTSQPSQSKPQPTLTTGLQLGLQQQQQTSMGTQGLSLQLGNQSKPPTSSLAPLTINTSLLSQPAKTTAATTSGIGGIGLQTIGKPPPAYTAPSTTASIPATSTAGGAPTGKKYTYKQLEKMINEVSVECLCVCVVCVRTCVCVFVCVCV